MPLYDLYIIVDGTRDLRKKSSTHLLFHTLTKTGEKLGTVSPSEVFNKYYLYYSTNTFFLSIRIKFQPLLMNLGNGELIGEDLKLLHFFYLICFQSSFSGRDVFAGILPMCESNYAIIKTVFSNPDQVMSKYILNIFHLKLHKYIQTKLADKSDIEKYLKNLYEMYTK